MNDPKVEELCYRLITENPNDKFDNASPLFYSLPEFNLRIIDGMLTIQPQKKYTNVDQVKADIEPFLRTWELTSFLNGNRHRIRFAYSDAKIVDLKPDPQNHTIAARSSIHAIIIGENLSLVRQNTVYPSPVMGYVASDLTDELILRLKHYIDGRETLPSMTFYILERLQIALSDKQGDKRKNLSQKLKISQRVLKQLGNLTNRADPEIGRHAKGIRIPLTQKEKTWMEHVVFRLVSRLAEFNAGNNILKFITLRDFPPLI